jgi:hypothetical protein
MAAASELPISTISRYIELNAWYEIGHQKLTPSAIGSDPNTDRNLGFAFAADCGDSYLFDEPVKNSLRFIEIFSPRIGYNHEHLLFG